ncbi:hypothetical protein ACVWWF_003560 [Pseudomonas tolaasii]
MLQQFLHDFGYFALFLGTFFEGETILVLAGFLAFRGYMDINLVVIVAFLWQLRRRPVVVLPGAQARPQIAGTQAALAVDG